LGEILILQEKSQVGSTQLMNFSQVCCLVAHLTQLKKKKPSSHQFYQRLSLSPRGFPFWAKKQSWSGSR
jgi:hypothetical protein